MFNRRKSQFSKPFQIDTLIGTGTRVEGNVHIKGGLHLDGTVDGNIIAESDSNSRVSISDSGTVQGSINAPTVILNGLVQGDIVAHTRVDLGATAKVNGNVHYGLIEMAMGAQINGKLIHQSAIPRDPKPVDTTVVPAVVVDIGNTAKTKLG